MLILITIISFLLGFIINLIALPYILEYIVKDAWRYIRNISTLSVFCWSVSIIGIIRIKCSDYTESTRANHKADKFKLSAYRR